MGGSLVVVIDSDSRRLKAAVTARSSTTNVILHLRRDTMDTEDLERLLI